MKKTLLITLALLAGTNVFATTGKAQDSKLTCVAYTSGEANSDSHTKIIFQQELAPSEFMLLSKDLSSAVGKLSDLKYADFAKFNGQLLVGYNGENSNAMIVMKITAEDTKSLVKPIAVSLVTKQLAPQQVQMISLLEHKLSFGCYRM